MELKISLMLLSIYLITSVIEIFRWFEARGHQTQEKIKGAEIE